MSNNDEFIKIDMILSCARCGGDHKWNFQAEKLSISFAPEEAGGVEWTHWLPCPINGQPILVRIAPE